VDGGRSKKAKESCFPQKISFRGEQNEDALLLKDLLHYICNANSYIFLFVDIALELENWYTRTWDKDKILSCRYAKSFFVTRSNCNASPSLKLLSIRLC
jgi:hypothetical protein